MKTDFDREMDTFFAGYPMEQLQKVWVDFSYRKAARNRDLKKAKQIARAILSDTQRVDSPRYVEERSIKPPTVEVPNSIQPTETPKPPLTSDDPANGFRFILKAISVVLGFFIISSTFTQHVEYRGLNSPLLGLLLGGALIFTPLNALGWVFVYILFVAPILVGFVIGLMLGAGILGSIGLMPVGGFIGGIAGGALGVKIISNEPYLNFLRKLKQLISGDKNDSA